MYGIQTNVVCRCKVIRFENDVKMYGIQTQDVEFAQQLGFENDVKMYGIQTNVFISGFL